MPSPFFVLNGQVGLVAWREQLAGSGKYFIVTNPTPGTAIAYADQTGFSATANGLFGIQNTNASGGPTIYLDYLSLIMTGTAPTATTSMRLEVYNETGLVSLTGNVATRTPIQPNIGYPQTTGAIVQSFAAGAATVPAAVGTRRLQSVLTITTSLGITGDNYVIDFGGDHAPTAPLTAVRSTAAAKLVTQGPPLTIAPQSTSWINLWWLTAATTAPSFEFELTYGEL